MSAQILRLSDMPRKGQKLETPPNRIREWREKHGLTLDYLAGRIGVTATELSRFERGERPIRLDRLQKIAQILGTDVGQLLNPEDNATSLSSNEQLVLEAMRAGEEIARPVLKLAEGLLGYTAEEEAEKKRA